MPLLPGVLPGTSRCYNNGCHLTCQDLITFSPLILASPVYSQILTELAERNEDLALPTNLDQHHHQPFAIKVQLAHL